MHSFKANYLALRAGECTRTGRSGPEGKNERKVCVYAGEREREGKWCGTVGRSDAVKQLNRDLPPVTGILN